MLLNIQHETIYQYSHPVDYTIQHLRLTPRMEAQQRALNWKISAPGRYQRHTDAYGNIGHILVMDSPHHEIRIVVSGQISVDEQNAHRPSDGGEVPVLAYLQETRLTQADEAVRDLARRHLEPHGARIDTLFKLIGSIQEKVAYIPGSSDVQSTAIQTLAQGSGVCQDHAHLFIACCRAMDLPARYVSGYIHPGGSLHAASHAWADVWVEGLGWISFDITHNRFTGPEHCRLAVGRDYLDACPVRGVRRGGGEEAMAVKVMVSHGAQQQ
ncbi:MAG: transglutaminase family protein [Proteobacteria bacterium]|nr:transglutaminase family protein [Pseudomonadota bacterium]